MSFLLVVKVTIFVSIIFGVIIFVLKKVMFDSTQGAVNRLHHETEEVRKKQTELNEKIKQANEELAKRRAEADALVAKMTEEAQTKAREEREKIIKKSREDSEEIISKAQKTKDEMRKTIEREMAIKTVDFTAIIMGEVLSQKPRTSFDESLISEFLDSLEKVDMTMIGEEVNTAEIITATPIVDKLKTRLAEILKKKLNRTITINSTVDNKIIAGTLLKFGGLSLDGSLHAMIKEKTNEVKEKIERGLLKLG